MGGNRDWESERWRGEGTPNVVSMSSVGVRGMDKAYILQEIRRTAEANGGVALGWRKFESDTGIKRSDWHKKFWAGWGDAVREAGFPPNPLSIRYEKPELLEKYATLAVELGRLPTSDHLSLKSNRDAQFPSEKAFRRLGSKLDLVAQLLEYCGNHEGYEDVIRLCKEYVSRNRKASDEPRDGEEEIRFVYLMRSGRFYKMGRSNASGRREYELNLQLPEKPKTVHTIRTDRSEERRVGKECRSRWSAYH